MSVASGVASRGNTGRYNEDLSKYIVAAPSMQGNQPMRGEILMNTFSRLLVLPGEPVH